MSYTPPTTPPADVAQPLREAAAAIQSGDFEATARLLADPAWRSLEAKFWHAAHPLPPAARAAQMAYIEIAKQLWDKSGLGQAEPIAIFKSTLLTNNALETALRVLARIYAGCNLSFCAPPAGFWKTVYVLTERIVSDRFSDQANRAALLNQILQLWLMAWLNPLSLAPGRLPVAVRLVGILSKKCSFTRSPPTHAGSGLAAADMLSDSPPMPFARVPISWEPESPIYINAQDAAFTIRELATPPSRSSPSDVYESLLQSALQVGLSAQEMQDFVRRAMREFGYSNMRAIARVGRLEKVSTVIGFIECWSAIQGQSKSSSVAGAFATHQALVINHSDGGFLLRFQLKDALLSVGSLLCLRGGDAEPWTIAVIRWLDDENGVVMVGCEVLCNYADARIAQRQSSTQHLPFIGYQRDNATWVIGPYETSDATTVAQLRVDDEIWVVAVAAEFGEDWQRAAVLDSQKVRG